MNKIDIVKQTKLAFEFIEKLYYETSYLVKEIEGMLTNEPEEFHILKPGGYAVSTYRSVGLQSENVPYWLLKNGMVCFAAKEDSELQGGYMNTKFRTGLKILALWFVLYDRKLDEPEIWAGVLYNIKPKSKDHTKFEQLMRIVADEDKKVFQKPGESTYEDHYCSFKLNLTKKPLYSIKSADDIKKEIIDHLLSLYRSH